MNFTQNQQNAIDARDCSLIVSAGAGSGKTAVLTERILGRICDQNDNCNITDFLVVTFTNAAANELSDRIRKKLSSRAEEEPDNKKIINNIALLPLAKISTINAFCYELVRNNFQKLSLPASVRIADETEIAVIRQKLMNETIDEYFENKGDDAAFLAAYEIFSSAKNDKGFVETLLELDAKLRSLANPEDYCKKILDGYLEILECSEFFDTDLGKILYDNTKKRAEKCILVMQSLIEMCSGYEKLIDAYVPSLESERDFARQVLCSLEKGYQETRKTVLSYEKTSLKAVRNFEEPMIKDIVKDSKNEVAGDFVSSLFDTFACTQEQLMFAAQDTHDVISSLFAIVGDFSKKLDDRKRELSVIEFSDAERYALSLLVKSIEPFETTDLAKQLSDNFDEIYIDEYQDVNPLQDLIFKAISKRDENGEYSRFMVGDIKQSIYRFRGARSDIFMSYRDSFSDIDTENAGAKRIFMSDNFRCAESVIKLANAVFSRLMEEYFTEGDALLFSRKEQVKVSAPCELCVFAYDKTEAENIARDELEGALIADKINELVANPGITDSDGKMYEYSDIGILTRSKSALKTYERVLAERGIPTESDVGESFFGKRETLLCLNILNSIDNPERDIYLAGFMRSMVGGFSDSELALIKHKSRRLSLYKSVKNYGEDDETNNTPLGAKCREFVERLTYYRRYSRGKSAEKLVWKIYCDMDLFNACSSRHFTNNKNSTRQNLLKFYRMARDFSKTSFHGLGAFIDYINGYAEKGDVKSERESASGCVRLMTIHASKGLEFPICFVGDLSRKFNRSDETSRLVFSENDGIAVTLCDTEGMKTSDTSTGLISINTPFRRLVASRLDKEMLDEEVRILYVALTRARDRLILTGAYPKKAQNSMMDALIMNKSGLYFTANNYLSLLLGVLADETALTNLYSNADLSYIPSSKGVEDVLKCSLYSTRELAERYKDMKTGVYTLSFETENNEIDAPLYNHLKDVGSFELPKSNAPSKITVSQLKIGLIDEERTAESKQQPKQVETPRFVMENAGYTSADRGTAIHLFMQFAHYEACEKDCRAEADRLCDEGFIEKYQRELLDIELLERFFAGSFYRKIKSSRKIYREQRFNLEVDAFDTLLSGDILVQGVIDLFFENDDGTYTVVDFKTDRVFGDGAEKVLIERHKEQLMYYKRAVEEMTGCKVRDAVIYSFSLMKEISIL